MRLEIQYGHHSIGADILKDIPLVDALEQIIKMLRSPKTPYTEDIGPLICLSTIGDETEEEMKERITKEQNARKEWEESRPPLDENTRLIGLPCENFKNAIDQTDYSEIKMLGEGFSGESSLPESEEITRNRQKQMDEGTYSDDGGIPVTCKHCGVSRAFIGGTCCKKDKEEQEKSSRETARSLADVFKRNKKREV